MLVFLTVREPARGQSDVGISEAARLTTPRFPVALRYLWQQVSFRHMCLAAGLHSLQLEINRALYMDEARYERVSGFARLAADLETVARRLGEIPLEELRPYRAAAE